MGKGRSPYAQCQCSAVPVHMPRHPRTSRTGGAFAISTDVFRAEVDIAQQDEHMPGRYASSTRMQDAEDKTYV